MFGPSKTIVALILITSSIIIQVCLTIDLKAYVIIMSEVCIAFE